MSDPILTAKDRLTTLAGSYQRIGEDQRASDLNTILTELSRLEGLVNSPETENFMRGIPLEAAHQVERWGAKHDAGKGPLDWVWLLGHLINKAARAALDGDVVKAQHHTISSAAALANWHAQLSGRSDGVRPGIDAQARGLTGAISLDDLSNAESAEGLLAAAREYVADALEAHEHSDGRELLSKIDAVLCDA